MGALNLKGLGMNTEASIEVFLSANGFQQVKDKDVAQRENLPTLIDGVPGYWLHPETSNYTPDYFTGFAIGFFGGYPVAFMRVYVVDTNGEVVLQAKASGQGKKQIIGANLSEENLTLALDNAIMKLNELIK